ncbi:MAG: hypothetical protein ACR2OM_11970 [Aestuariivirgaceae bacterium]
MFKNTIIAAAAVAATVFAFQPQEAQAGPKVNFHIGVGGPYYGYHSPYYGGPTYYGGPAYHAPRYRVGCRQARRMLRHRGFRHIRVRDCHGKRYSFRARRGGDWWIVKVSSRTGRILRVIPT